MQPLCRPGRPDSFDRHTCGGHGCAILTVTNIPNTSIIQRLIKQFVSMRPAHGSGSASTLTFAGTPDEQHQAGKTEGLPTGLLTPPEEPGELGRLGPYRVFEVLGAGGMGIVFRAEEISLARTVALKVMTHDAAARPGARQRFLREARAAAALEHEHVAPIFQVGEVHGVPYLAMQWLKGMNLAERLKRLPAPNVAEVLQLGRQIARGLAAAHARGIIHRDIKPQNVWIEPKEGGRIKILDFGLARALQDDIHLTQTGAIVGTPAFMAPEQARGEKVDQRSDLFSLGVVLYRMATGRLPFRGENTMAVLSSLATEQPRPARELNPSLPAALASLVMRLLEKDPAKRPASAAEVANQLESLERRHAAAPSSSARAPSSAGPKPRRVLVLATGLGAVIVMAAIFAATVVRYATNKGVLVVQVEDPAIEITIKQGGMIVQDRTTRREFQLVAGAGEIEVFEPASGLTLATKRFQLARGGKETVIVELERAQSDRGAPRDAKAAAVLDRTAAEWVISLGGTVQVEGHGDIRARDQLPVGDWQLVEIKLPSNPNVRRVGLANLEGLTNLRTLDLARTRLPDSELKHFKGLTKLRDLNLGETEVTDEGLARIGDLTSLVYLAVHPRITDAGLVHLKRLTNLEGLILADPGIHDAGLAHLIGLTRLRDLTLGSTQVTDAGLKQLSAWPTLTRLALSHMPNITDAGLVSLTELPNLRELELNGPDVTNACLARLRGLPHLTKLGISCTRVSDAGLEHLRNLNALEYLDFHGTHIKDTGMKHLGALRSLRHLSLDGTAITDAGLPGLFGLSQLRELNLSDTRVTSAGVAALKKALPECKVRMK